MNSLKEYEFVKSPENKTEKRFLFLEEQIKELKESKKNTDEKITNYTEQIKKVDKVEEQINSIYGQFIIILITLFGVAFMSVSLYSLMVSLLPEIAKIKDLKISSLVTSIGIIIFTATAMIQAMIYFLFSAYRQFIKGEDDHCFKITHPTLIIYGMNLLMIIILIFIDSKFL